MNPTKPQIQKLPEDVINKIAAGEVLHRPANAVKEMIENSLDAQATSIKVSISEGGLKLIQIIDNGHGIKKEDLPLVCERFATSKLSCFDDLRTITTFGFRGEALASISHVAMVTIISKTETQPCAFKAHYLDGKLCASAPGRTAEVQPVAGNTGTQITVEDLFYNCTSRRNTFKSTAEEYQRIVEVIMRYAVNNPHVNFICKKTGDQFATVNSQIGSEQDVIGQLFGVALSKQIMSSKCHNDELKFKAEILSTNSSYRAKKTTFILFINRRLVEYQALKKALEDIYLNFLPKGAHPFIYVNIECAPENVDVNVHPTKAEVQLANGAAIIESLQRILTQSLSEANSRTFMANAPHRLQSQSPSLVVEKPTEITKKIAPQKLARNDSNLATLDVFLSGIPTKQQSRQNVVQEDGIQTPHLTSIQLLVQHVNKNSHVGLQEVFQDCTFVGCADTAHCLIQHRTRLLLLNTYKISKEIIFQKLLTEFATFGSIVLSPPVSLQQLILVALDSPRSGWKASQGSKQEFAEVIADNMKADLIQRFVANFTQSPDKLGILQEYFSTTIDENASLCSLPLIFNDYTPDTSELPFFVLSLNSVNWEDEEVGLHQLCQIYAELYSLHPSPDDDMLEQYAVTIQRIFLPAMKQFKPSRELASNKAVVEIASLDKLYKVFERC